MSKKLLSLYVGVLTLLPGYMASAQTAALYLEPATGVFPIGEPFTVDVRLDSNGTAVGTADATLVYDPADVSYVAVSDEASVMSRILVDSTTNTGRIELSGFVERGTPPYTGTNGLIATLTFLPLRNVATEIRFASGAATPPLSLGASVGSLANVLSNLRSGTYTFIPREVVPPAEVAGAFTEGQDAFAITASPAAVGGWFGTTSLRLTWSLPPGAVEMRTGVATTTDAVPDTTYPVPVTGIDLNELAQGEQYFLLQFKYGESWGSVIRYPLQIDLTPPNYITAREVERADSRDPRVAFTLEASDALSGVASYELSIDGGDTVSWDGAAPYEPEGLTPGEHVLSVTAIDRAGNRATEDVLFLVQSLESPILTDAPDRVLTGDAITVRGTTYPDALVTVFTSIDDGEASERTVTSDATGVFVATIADAARSGKYTVWFQVTDERGAMSPPSIKRSIPVSQPYIMLFGTIAVTYLSVIVPLLGLIVLLGLVLWLGFSYVRTYRRRVRTETGDAYRVVNEEFEALRDELRSQIGMLEKANQSRELTREEMRIFNDLSKRLDQIEMRIEREIDDITVHHDEAEEYERMVHNNAGVTEKKPVRSGTPLAPKAHTLKIERR